MGNEALNWDGLRVYEKKRMETAVFRLQYVAEVILFIDCFSLSI